MYKVTWTFEKLFEDDDFEGNFSEMNDINYYGYQVIDEDAQAMDSSDDMHLKVQIEHLVNQ